MAEASTMTGSATTLELIFGKGHNRGDDTVADSERTHRGYLVEPGQSWDGGVYKLKQEDDEWSLGNNFEEGEVSNFAKLNGVGARELYLENNFSDMRARIRDRRDPSFSLLCQPVMRSGPSKGTKATRKSTRPASGILALENGDAGSAGPRRVSTPKAAPRDWRLRRSLGSGASPTVAVGSPSNTPTH